MSGQTISGCVLACFHLLLQSSLSESCGDEDSDDTCWYNVWYFWMAVICLAILLLMLIIYCLKRYKTEQNRIQDMERAHKPLTVAPGPPGYNEPSHEPPGYTSRPGTGHRGTTRAAVHHATTLPSVSGTCRNQRAAPPPPPHPLGPGIHPS